MNQIIIHVDMDAFYAAVETRDDPTLLGKPLIIGSLPNERGVVATCSYEARKYGVRSGMNIKEAYRLCPNGIYRHPDFDKYRIVSGQLHEIWNAYASACEYVALDEAYLDVTRQAGSFDGAGEIARTIKRRTREEIGLSCSVGVAYSKTAAKTASEEKKPDGYFEIRTAEEFVSLIIDRDVRVLYTVGEKTAQKMNAVGILTVRDISQRREEVIRLFGRQGQWIVQLASGTDERKVIPYRPEDAKSIGREITFQQDVASYAFLKDILFLLSLCVDHRAKRVGLYGKGVTLKLTYADMKSITRSHTLDFCDSAAIIYREALNLLGQVDRKPVRLIGVSMYNLGKQGAKQLSIWDMMENGEKSGERTIKEELDRLRDQYQLDFEGHMEQIYHGTTLYRTAEYMRKHMPAGY